MDFYIEGPDGVGKTATIKNLKKHFPNHNFHDRNREVVTNKMTKNTPLETRAKTYEEFLKTTDSVTIVLINDDGRELLNRVQNRNQAITESDMEAPLYNKLYKETYEYMARNNMRHDKLFCINATGFEFNMQMDAVIATVQNILNTRREHYLDLETGKIGNKRRRFIIDPSAPADPEGVKNFLGKDPVQHLIIWQFYVENKKYRCLLDPSNEEEHLDDKDYDKPVNEWGNGHIGYTKTFTSEDIDNIWRISSDEYQEALRWAKHVALKKHRFISKIHQGENVFTIKTDYYEKPSMIIDEISGDNLDKFVPPPFLKEVTDKSLFTAEEIYKSLVKTATVYYDGMAGNPTIM